MKHLIASILLLATLSATAQTHFLMQGNTHATPLNSPLPHNFTIDYNSVVIDYDSADARAFNNQYKRLMHPINMHHTASDSAIQYCIVAFDSLYNVYADTAYATDSVSTLGLDSLILFLGHENNSGIADTLHTIIIGLNSNGYPQPNNVLAVIETIIPANNPLSGNWKNPVAVVLHPYLSITGRRFAVMLQYYGSTLDTMGIVAGFGNTRTCADTTVLNADTTHYSRIRKQISSDKFYANSFALWTHLQVYGTLPTVNGSNIYFDCDNNNQYNPGTDGESYLQNIKMMAFIQTNSASIDEWINANMISLFPVPATNNLTVSFDLNKSLSGHFIITDVMGKQLLGAPFHSAANEQTTTIDVSALNAGIYFLQLKTTEGTAVKKFTVVK